MAKLLRNADHRRMPWKNGGGETVEVIVHPEGASLSDFGWRVSMATVASDGPFSVFPGIDRTLAVLSGEGMDLSIEGLGDRLLTPPATSSILTGITRDTVMQLAMRLGLTVTEQPIPREALYLTDELFFTGTAAEISPIRSVDKITIGSGKRGEITKRLQDEFFKIILAEREAPNNAPWLTFVHGEKAEQKAS